VNLLLAGYDDSEKKASLYFMDYLASGVELPYCAHGYGSYFTLSTMDAYYKPGCYNEYDQIVTFICKIRIISDPPLDLTFEQGMELLRKCVKEIALRMVVNLPRFKVKAVDQNGIRDVGIIVAKDLL